MAKRKIPDPKEESLREHGTLNSQADKVKDPLFHDDPFFDRRDLLQVKYEMLRQAQVDGEPVAHAASAFGFSRPVFYQAQSAFREEGLTGLLPKKRGPHGGHKLTEEVVECLSRERERDEKLSSKVLAEIIKERFGLTVHPTSIDRVLRAVKKKRR